MRVRSMATILLVLVFWGIIAALWWHSANPNRWLWTAIIAFVPLMWLIIGYHRWRVICPLARTSVLPQLLWQPRLRMPSWLVRLGPLVPLALMVICLTLRHTTTNGSASNLLYFLIGLFALAFICGALFVGKSWCSYICPIGFVEQIYLSPARTGLEDSKCKPCVGCTNNCPDIDLENSYWKARHSWQWRLVTLAWPGIVIGFYFIFYLYRHEWSDYFSGVWTKLPAPTEVALIDSLWPLSLIAGLVMIGLGAVSVVVFLGIEKLTALRFPRKANHIVLALAGYTAFNGFYLFAGKPTIATWPLWLQVAVSSTVVAVSTWVLFAKLASSENDYLTNRMGKKLLKRWNWGEKPDIDVPLAQVKLIKDERERFKEERNQTYRRLLQDLLSDGVVTKAEREVLDQLRDSLGITVSNHANIVANLSEQDQAILRGDIRLPPQDQISSLDAWLARGIAAGQVPTQEEVSNFVDDPDLAKTCLEKIFAKRTSKTLAMVRRLSERRHKLGLAVDIAKSLGGDGASNYATFCAWLFNWREQNIDDELRRSLERLETLGYGGSEDQTLFPAGASPQLLDLLVEEPPLVVAAGALLAPRQKPFSHEKLLQYTESEFPLVRSSAYRALAVTKKLSPLLASRAAEDPADIVANCFRVTDSADEAGFVTVGGAPSSDMSPVEKMAYLHNLELLRALPPEDLERMTPLLEQRQFKDRDPLCKQQQWEDDVYILTDGVVEIIRDGRELALLRRGDVLGELAALDGSPREADAIARGPVNALAMSGADFRALVTNTPPFANTIISSLTQRLRTANR